MDAERRFDRIETRLDSIDANLERHMKRSDALEAQVEPVKILLIEMKAVVKFLKLVGLVMCILEACRALKMF